MTKRSLGKTKVSLATVIIVICLVATAVAVYWIETEEPMEQVYGATFQERNLINFSKVGNLTKNAPGMEKNAWYLLYEEPGKPALSAKLSFDTRSVYNFSGTDEACSISKLRTGKRAEVTGRISNGVVGVQTLKFVK